jgi:CheY-like chemotaxis protein
VIFQPGAFLSYTRIDDEFFGGAITSLRKLLELGVQVVTGNREFCIFQDVDGIELGQQWQDRLDEAITSTKFLIPIVTPCFFESSACRDELGKFVEHERALRRGDLILPIYFVTTPLFEKPDLLKDDPLASEIRRRQWYDWRLHADLPITDPLIRRAVRELAEQIAMAISRVPVLPPNQFRIEPELKNLSEVIESQKSPHDKKKIRKVLWVDDRPDNNVWERQALSAYNIEVTLALSTGEALATLRNNRFDAIISDMGRPPDPRAGYTLLDAMRASGDLTPYFIYAGSNAPKHLQEALARGAQGSTNIAAVLIAEVLKSLEVDVSKPSSLLPR